MYMMAANKSRSEEEQPADAARPLTAGGGDEEEGFTSDPTAPEPSNSLSSDGDAPSGGGACSDPVGKFRAYAKSGDLLELLGWVVSMVILAGIPHLAARMFWRDIPYQKTAAGDVLVELMYSNELVDETINNELLVVLGVLVPLLVQIILGFACGDRWQDVHRSICTYVAAIGISTFVVEFVKHYAGYLRPNFYEKCGFDYDTAQCDPDIDTNGFTGRKSFMSGHSSMSFAGLTVLSLYMQRLFGVGSGGERAIVIGGIAADSPDGGAASVTMRYVSACPSRLKRVVSLLCLLPMFLAVFIAASRVHDNYHHPADVVGGSVVGASAAIWAMGLWYPPLFSVTSA